MKPYTLTILLIFVSSCKPRSEKEQNGMTEHNGTYQQMIRELEIKGTSVSSNNEKMTFEIPQAWIRWSTDHPNRPNLYVTQEQLQRIEVVHGEWDKEFSEILNKLFPFSASIAHLGSESWGETGISYADLQLRVYCFNDKESIAPEKFIAQIETAALTVVNEIGSIKKENEKDWEHFHLNYPRFYQDYGAIASMDFYFKNYKKQQIALVFMHTDQHDHSRTIEQILDSFILKH